MKGNLKKILFVLLTFVAPLAFTSCDDEDGDPSTPQKLIAGGRLYYSFSFSQDLLDVAEMNQILLNLKLMKNLIGERQN